MDGMANDAAGNVLPQAGKQQANILHFYNLSSNQEHNTQWCVPLKKKTSGREVKRRMQRIQFKHWEKHMMFPYHMIQETNTMVASLKELKNLIRISPSSPSFLKATPNAIAKTIRPRMFIPSTSAPTGV